MKSFHAFLLFVEDAGVLSDLVMEDVLSGRQVFVSRRIAMCQRLVSLPFRTHVGG